mgnify:FL=1|jgi:hypothetical protein
MKKIIVEKTFLEHSSTFGLTASHVWVYSLLRARVPLSIRSGWVDQRGAYVIYPVDKLAEASGFSARKVHKLLHDLAAAKLLTIAPTRTASRLYIKQWRAPSSVEPVEYLREAGFPALREINHKVCAGAYVEIDLDTGRDLPLRVRLLHALLSDTLATESGLVYPDRRKLQAMLSCGHATLSACFAQLGLRGLIESAGKSFGGAVAFRLNGLNSADQSSNNCSASVQNLQLQSSKICSQDNLSEITSFEDSPLGDSLTPAACEASARVEWNNLADDAAAIAPAADKAEIEVAVRETRRQYMADMLSTKPTYRVRDGVYASREQLIAAYESITHTVMAVTVAKIAAHWRDVRDGTSYLRSTLMSAVSKHSGEAWYYSQQMA